MSKNRLGVAIARLGGKILYNALSARLAASVAYVTYNLIVYFSLRNSFGIDQNGFLGLFGGYAGPFVVFLWCVICIIFWLLVDAPFISFFVTGLRRRRGEVGRRDSTRRWPRW